MNEIKLFAPYCFIDSKWHKGLSRKLYEFYVFIYPILFFSSQPVPLADIEQVTLVKVQKEDQISSTVMLYLQNSVQKVNIIIYRINNIGEKSKFLSLLPD